MVSNFKKTIGEFEQDMRENTLELTKDVDRAREIEAEIPALKEKLRHDESELNRLRPKIREEEHEKMEFHRQVQLLEQENRKDINEHLHDKSKMIKPIDHKFGNN